MIFTAQELNDELKLLLLSTDVAKASEKQDYCPNGLQVEGAKKDTAIRNIVTGVTASLELIREAVKLNADAIIVHHGYFWKGESRCITGMMRDRIQMLLANNINLYAYHLPLDINPDLGNNIMLGKHLEIFTNIRPVIAPGLLKGLLYTGDILNQKKGGDIGFSDFSKHLEAKLLYKPLAIKGHTRNIKRIAWCTGAGQSFILKAYELGYDTFFSGEISEQNGSSGTRVRYKLFFLWTSCN